MPASASTSRPLSASPGSAVPSVTKLAAPAYDAAAVAPNLGARFPAQLPLAHSEAKVPPIDSPSSNSLDYPNFGGADSMPPAEQPISFPTRLLSL